MKTATPAMARAINDRLALDLLLERGPLTAPQLRELTGLSRPTVSDLIERLTQGGLIEITGESGETRRGPNARVYGLVAGRAHVAGVDLRRETISVAIADITGRVVARTSRAVTGDLVDLVAGTLAEAAGDRVIDNVVVGAPGLVAPRDGELVTANDVPGWRAGLVTAWRERLGLPLVLENEVNLAAIAELRTGAAQGAEDFVLMWVGDGVGAAVVLGGRLRRGASGGAGEVGFLQVDGTAFCNLVTESVARGLDRARFADRIAQGVFAFVTLLDPGLVVLGGEAGQAGGDELAAEVAARLHELSPAPTEVRASTVEGNAVLQGAVLTALDLARDHVFG
ncbi:putative NBD/HSP70 family sugar kinase/biotin operon repressor [Nonomuraea thailandensis]|uniref:NBD/HSP70 family sugar kinase/biotin operon repressor n=1 Tax=Nonomuraea thailandensis TaxID=1188745 RepID=A0A9X2GP40_9ACTN|nr:ROK family transcriptional regulator [Nonomuraea thailandensis]MCP2361024.1 putative NBD/HSP70 family sugar kinase/biotin operon repressor [Nonomuraea thailandensis]